MSHPQEIPIPEAAPLNLRDSMLQLAHDICANEIAPIPNLMPNTMEEQWGPIDLSNPAIFAAPLLLPYVKVERPDESSFQVTAAEFTLVDDETTIRVGDTDESLDDDSFIRYFYDQFKQTYAAHQHEQCTPIRYIRRLVQVYVPDTGLYDIRSV
jgi:hypothetical protein